MGARKWVSLHKQIVVLNLCDSALECRRPASKGEKSDIQFSKGSRPNVSKNVKKVSPSRERSPSPMQLHVPASVDDALWRATLNTGERMPGLLKIGTLRLFFVVMVSPTYRMIRTLVLALPMVL